MFGVDVNEDRVVSIVGGDLPFFEAGLKTTLHRVFEENRFRATADVRQTIEQTDYIFICVGTPSRTDGSMDDSYLRRATKNIAEVLSKDIHPLSLSRARSFLVPRRTLFDRF